MSEMSKELQILSNRVGIAIKSSVGSVMSGDFIKQILKPSMEAIYGKKNMDLQALQCFGFAPD